MASNNTNDQVLVKAKRPFDGIEGFKDEASEPFKVSRFRLAEMLANDLVIEIAAPPEAKVAPAPENKMAISPANKSRIDRA